MLLDERCQLFPISAETKELLLEGSSQAATARAILSESNQLLTDAVMYNTRDTPVEKAVDRVLLLPYLVKQGRDFDDVDRTLPVAITNCSSLMLSLLDSQSMSRSPFLGGLMGHVTDTTSVFKNIERFERLSGRLGDVASMLHHQNCNCPFKFHHCSDRTEEENLMPSFIHFEDEIDKCEISKTPYQVHVLMAIKNYVANISRIDPSVGGPSVIRRLREWSDMGAGTRYIGSFIADRKTVQDSPFRVAGSNLDVIVRPAAARDASTNILKTLARANASLDDISTTVGLLPELLTAIALFFNKNVSEIISDMVSKSSSAYTIDPATGDVTVDGGRLPVLNNTQHDSRTTTTAATTNSSGDRIRGPAPWQDMAKIHVRNILNQLISNPLSHIMVQGDPIGNVGIETVERK
ncbi:hypothetical protein C7M84_010716 [Penaeus vannamei]|uniref:Uncharacterized protein n=1 Tax=Penaeus vannamei TaxID=6689 RepID=A0A423T386_PENVA|nr:hypothetical protein C7M84_010716 [Penaeus vannamei]